MRSDFRKNSCEIKKIGMEVAVISKLAELFIFGVAPLLMGLTATAALPAKSIFDITWLAEDIEGQHAVDLPNWSGRQDQWRRRLQQLLLNRISG